MSLPRSMVLIGPSKAGKTTLVKKLSHLTQTPWIDLDDLRWDYYAEIGYDPQLAGVIRQQGGIKALADFWKPYDIHAVERVLTEYSHGYIIAFGAGHSVYDNPAQFARAQYALAPFPHVFLILPALNIDDACAVLRQRIFDADGLSEQSLDDLTEINRYFMKHPSNHRLAHHVIINADKTIDQTCSEMLSLLNT